MLQTTDYDTPFKENVIEDFITSRIKLVNNNNKLNLKRESDVSPWKIHSSRVPSPSKYSKFQQLVSRNESKLKKIRGQGSENYGFVSLPIVKHMSHAAFDQSRNNSQTLLPARAGTLGHLLGEDVVSRKARDDVQLHLKGRMSLKSKLSTIKQITQRETVFADQKQLNILSGLDTSTKSYQKFNDELDQMQKKFSTLKIKRKNHEQFSKVT
jgi:hypothetical protein